ncbi:MAG TPA: hypothetical protein V6D02_04125 [Candidatus Obscuribacterales bacterium]
MLPLLATTASPWHIRPSRQPLRRLSPCSAIAQAGCPPLTGDPLPKTHR